MKNKSGLLIYLLLIFKFINAQQTISLTEIEKAYKGDFTISSKAVYKYYPEYDKGPPSDSLNAFLVICGNDYYFKISEYEIIKEGEYYLSADHNIATIQLIRTNSEQSQLSLGLIDDLLSQQNAKLSEFDTKNEALKGIRINYQNNEIIQADLFIDLKTNLIKKCTIKYLDGVDENTQSLRYAKLEITYFEWMKENNKVITENYRLNKFITISGDEITLNSSFKSYDFQTDLN